MLKNDIHKSIFGNIDFLPYGACVIVKKGLETKFSRMEKMANFFYVIYIRHGNIRQSINFINFFPTKNILHSDYMQSKLFIFLKFISQKLSNKQLFSSSYFGFPLEILY